MSNPIDRVFNWKKHPDGVLVVAIPLALFGLAICMIRIVIEVMMGNWAYALLPIFFGALAYMGFVPIYRLYKINSRFDKKDES